MDNTENYTSISIPAQGERQSGKRLRTFKKNGLTMVELVEDAFAEIDIAEPPSQRAAVPIPPAGIADKQSANLRTRFQGLRDIEKKHMILTQDEKKVFYLQGTYMADFEDDYDIFAPMKQYYPCYRDMRYEQLRSFFTWRTQIRKGEITQNSLSYAFLYIYEILNNIGVENPRDGLEKLMTFWRSYRQFDPTLDRHLLPWIKDYHIYYDLEPDFCDFAIKENIVQYYPSVFCYDYDIENSFDLYSTISKYKIEKSVYYSQDTHSMISACFHHVITGLRRAFLEKNHVFENFVFYVTGKHGRWLPFANAVFYPVIPQRERVVDISFSESYICRKNQWLCSAVMLLEGGRLLVGYVLKEMESVLRSLTGFKYKISADIQVCDNQLRKKIKALDIDLPGLIVKLVHEFHSLSTRTVVTVDVEALHKIREEALNIQEKLIIEEETPTPAPMAIVEEIPLPEDPKDGWSVFVTSLTEIELAALTNILQNRDIKSLSIKNGLMPEVLVDAINQKAADTIGDTIMEFDTAPAIYDEYREPLMEIIVC